MVELNQKTDSTEIPNPYGHTEYKSKIHSTKGDIR